MSKHAYRVEEHIMSEHPYRFEEEPAIAFGTLEAGGAALPLQRIDIHARVSGIHAHVTLEQHYRNDRGVVLEVVYIFPAPAMGAISSYTFMIDGVATRGTLLEREQARVVYDQAIAAGHSASTLEEDRPEVMTVRIGNVPPGSTARVRIGIDLLLPIADDCAVLRLPLLVGARYVPGTPLGTSPVGDGTGNDTDAAPDASRVTPPLAAGDLGVRVGVLVDLHGTSDVVATHPIEIDRREQSMRIRIADVVPDGDIVLRFPLAARDHALFVPDPTGGQGTLIVTSCTSIAASTLPLDVVVLLDRSGSMEGGKMVAARRAAASIVESLTPRDRVMVIAFDHALEMPLGAALVQATASQRRRAIDHLDAIEARGGTEMAAPLGIAATALRGGTEPAPPAATTSRDDPATGNRGLIAKLLGRQSRGGTETAAPLGKPSRRRAIVLVTDGQVANEDQLVELASRSGAEVLAVAIGAAANQGLCRRLASATGGGYEAAESDAQLGGALDRTLRRLLAPALEDLDLATVGASLVPGSRTPRRAPRLVPGIPVVLAARVTGVPTAAELHAVDPEGHPIVRTIPVEAIDAPSLPRVWARMRIRDLEDELASAPFPACIALEDTIVTTSLAHGVLSRYTAFVAVDARGGRTTPGGEHAKIVQPVVAVERAFKGSERASKTQAGTLKGKIQWMAPEQARGLPITAATDVFSLAVILYELASLSRLFRANDEFGTLQRIVEARIPPLPPTFAAIEPILRRALAADPSQRFRDAAEFSRALAQLPFDRSGLGELAARHARPNPHAGPVAARTRALWITERTSCGEHRTTYAASYAGPLVDAFPDAIVRVLRIDHGERVGGDPLPIAHPNVVRVLGVVATAERTHVFERVPGTDLLALTRALHAANTPLTPRQLHAIAIDTAAAVAAVHAAGELSRSLDPTHFVLSTSGTCILVELPLAPRGTTLPALPVPLRGLGRYLA